jgi:hypothetical protein
VALKPFETFIKSNEPSKWIAWQIKGNDFLKLGDTCPYCSTALAGEGQKETALAVEKEYDATAVGHLNTAPLIIILVKNTQLSLTSACGAQIEHGRPETINEPVSVVALGDIGRFIAFNRKRTN